LDSSIRHFRETPALARLVGESPAFLKTVEQLPAVAASEGTVLIVGETGTGKELVARALHYLSSRASFPFGHERGAFTGAHLRRTGLIAHAEKGTLFLDEVDTLPPKAQIDLLRVLQDKTFRLVGSSIEQHANVRIVAATNAPIEQLVAAGNFRPDLYYRLCLFSLRLLPLRERKEDIPELVNHLLEKHRPTGKATPKLTPAAQDALMRCEWPGNVRELENAIIRGIHLSKGDSINVEDLGVKPKAADSPNSLAAAAAHGRSFAIMKRAVIETFERDYLAGLMLKHRGNVSHAARAAGKDRRDLGKLLKKYQLQPSFFRGSTPLAASQMRQAFPI
jgi:DNA-binding NtrC family response regulator